MKQTDWKKDVTSKEAIEAAKPGDEETSKKPLKH